jgi:hypothetical protein
MFGATSRLRFRTATVVGFAVFALLSAAAPVFARTYFVSQNGDDSAPGTSSNSAWQSIERVNHAKLQPGDGVLFEAAASFSGNLRLTAEDAGTSNKPVVIGSYGSGKATILAGQKTGISVENAGGIAIENLIVVGSGRTNNGGYGVCCDNTLTNGQRLDYIHIDNVEARDFGVFGILVGGAQAGFDHVLVTNCVMHGNLRAGMEVAGRLPWNSNIYAHADVHVTHCQAFDNTGDPNYLKNHSGSGIILYQVDGGVMENCAAWNNGALCHSPGGGVGLWVCASRDVAIQNCESFSNRTSGGDGGGFDIDGGCIDCCLQYNYSHDNDGPGLMVYSYPYASFADSGSVVRFNISENDSRKGRRYAGLWVRTDGREITGAQIYNNTVMIGPWTDQAALIDARGIEASFRNNIFIANDSAQPLRVESPNNKVRFENNLYWHAGGPTRIVWGKDSYATLQEWRSQTGQESVGGKATGLFADPVLSSKFSQADASGHPGLKATYVFLPLPNSPALAGGLDLRKIFGLDPGERDFLGLLPQAGQFPLGAIGTPAVE